MLSNVTQEDWARAQAIALEYLRAERQVSAEISFRWYEHAPFLIAAWWTGGEAFVLVRDGVVQTARGVEALSRFFASLGVERLRAMSAGHVHRILGVFGADLTLSGYQGPWSNDKSFPELNHVLREEEGVLAYVAHYFWNPPPIRSRGPVAPPPPSGGSFAPGSPLLFERHSLQLFPVVPDLAWKLEARVEKPRG